MFIGREKELAFLEKQWASPRGRMVFLYGRRRIGKTETLKAFCKDKDAIFFTASEQNAETLKRDLSRLLLATGMPASQYIETFEDWKTLFESLPMIPSSGKKLLIIDEFPYLVKADPSIASILQAVWDNALKDENIMLVFCGSSMSFIEKHILAEKNPLYGRATGIWKMGPMDFYDAVKFFPKYSPEDAVLAFSVFGGTPYYLSMLDGKFSLRDNITNTILENGAPLHNEPEFLMRQEFSKPVTYNSILEAIAYGAASFDEIHKKALVEKSSLTAYLNALIDIGLVEKEFSMSVGAKQIGNASRGLYRLADPFFRFWFTFVRPNLGPLDKGDTDLIWTHVIEPKLNEYASISFEDICKDYLYQQNREGKLPFVFTKLGRWWHKGEEIDIVAESADRSRILLGECKFKNSPMQMIADFNALAAKMKLSDSVSPDYYLFSKSGFKKDLKQLGKGLENLHLITLDEIL